MGRVLVQLPGTTTAKAITETLSKNVIIVDEDLHQLRLHDGSTAGGHLIGNSAGSGVPVGTIIPFAGNSVPQGYLLCDGSAISRTTYASLFAVIGTIYGAGDGSTTFNIPEKHIHTGRVVGTGLSLGLTDGTLWGGLQPWYSSQSGSVMNINTGMYNVTTGSTQSGGTPFTQSKAIGVTETEGKSGLKVVRDPNIIMVIKY